MCPLQDSRRGIAGLNKLERGEVCPQLSEEAAVVAEVEVAEERLDGLGGLLSVVEGNAAVMES